MILFYLRPCANCGILIQGGSSLFCGDLCKQAARAVRHGRSALADGRLFDHPFVYEAIVTKLAFIAGGGYDNSGRQLSAKQRSNVMVQSDRHCVQCGALGAEIDHINGSSGSPDNLQFLCKPCHGAKTALSMRPASEDVVQSVHRPLWKRIEAFEPQQPSDTPGWRFRLWASTVPDKELAERWLSWSERRVTADPAIAAAGFPIWLEPGLWFGKGKPVQ